MLKKTFFYRHLLGHISSLTDMCLSPSGTRLLTADRDEKVFFSPPDLACPLWFYLKKVFLMSFCKGQFPYKCVNWSFIVSNMHNKMVRRCFPTPPDPDCPRDPKPKTSDAPHSTPYRGTSLIRNNPLPRAAIGLSA